MSPNQLSAELEKVLSQVKQYLPQQSGENLSDSELVNNFIHSTNTLSESERYKKYSLTRLSLYKSIVDELEHLPPALIMSAVHSAAAAIRILANIEDSKNPHDIIFYQIRKLGTGIAAATLFNVEGGRVLIDTYTNSPHIKSLAPEASPGDCFLFNAIYYATGQAPFNGIPVTPVVDHYFSRIKNSGVETTDNNAIALALDLSAKDIFGKENALLGRVSQRPKQNKPTKWPLLVTLFGLLIIWLLAN
jgi:hypothetical protein